ncbi:hypothetical protein ACIOJE_39455 [Kitasatospora sp. NPDC087861]|uniref:hypothetical protein n=1 Tax=Kitasatospora sp. NPDC087861 TaxID=3364070 RepID=UPI003823A646
MVLAPALTACSSITTAAGGSATAVPSASLVPPDRALHALDGLLDDSLAQIQPALTYWDGWPRSTEQAGGIDDHSLGYATAGRDRHIMTKIAPAKYATPLAMAGQSWKAKGYTVATPAASPCHPWPPPHPTATASASPSTTPATSPSARPATASPSSATTTPSAPPPPTP